MAGSLTLTPTAAGIYNYILTCTDAAGVARNASVQVVVRTPALQPVDGGNDGSGGGAFPVAGLALLALALAASLHRKHFC